VSVRLHTCVRHSLNPTSSPPPAHRALLRVYQMFVAELNELEAVRAEASVAARKAGKVTLAVKARGAADLTKAPAPA